MLHRHAALLLSLGAIPLLERFFTISWSFPYCNDPQDGPAYAALGTPLPYEMLSGTSSGEFLFMPHVYVMDVIVLSALAFFSMRWALSGVPTKGRTAFGALGLVLVSLAALSIAFDAYAGFLRPVRSIALDGYGRYSDFRPVSVGTPLSECRASPYWFPHGWVHK